MTWAEELALPADELRARAAHYRKISGDFEEPSDYRDRADLLEAKADSKDPPKQRKSNDPDKMQAQSMLQELGSSGCARGQEAPIVWL